MNFKNMYKTARVLVKQAVPAVKEIGTSVSPYLEKITPIAKAAFQTVVKHPAETVVGIAGAGFALDDLRRKIKMEEMKKESEIRNYEISEALKIHEAEIRVLKKEADKVPLLEEENDKFYTIVKEYLETKNEQDDIY